MNVAGRHDDSDPAGEPGPDEPTNSVWSRSGPDPATVKSADSAEKSASSVGSGADDTFAEGLFGPLPEETGSDVVDLTDDPFDDDLSAQLKARVPVRLNSRTTLALAGGVLIVAGFLGGVLVQKNYGVKAAPSRADIVAALAGGGFGNAAGAGAGGTGGTGTGGTGTGGTGTGGTGRGGTTGTVKFVDGTTVYLTNAAGDTITVKTSGTTTVRLSQTAALKDLPVGATVVVQGTADSDGIITATAVTAQK
jgi:hypothetical protein